MKKGDNIISAAEYIKNFSESGQSAYQEMSAVTNDFNHPSEDYVNLICTDLSAMMCTQNDGQNSGI